MGPRRATTADAATIALPHRGPKVNNSMTSSRRTFLKTGTAVALATLAKSRKSVGLAGNEPAISPRLSQFGYGDVQLLDGPLRQQFDTNHAFYLALDEDSLLKPYRQRAGLAAPGEDMGGWYSWAAEFKGDDNGFVPGHAFGQYLSGLSRAYAATGDRPTQQKVQRLVRGFAPAISSHFWDDYRLPAYTYDKISIGMIDAHEFAGDAQALKVLDAALDSVLPHLPPRGLSRAEQYARPHKDESFCWDEPYTLPENLFLAWQRGAGGRYRDLAIRFLADDWYFNPLAAGQNVLPGKHAYSHVNAMSSAMQAYFVLGSEKYLRAAQNGFDFLRNTQSFATGGWGPDEDFREPGSGEMGESLTRTHSSFETPCGSYGHFKITRYLLRVTRDSRYGDSMEKVLYNTILGARPLQPDGYSFYYSDYANNGSKIYYPEKWPCCSGTFPQVTADYGISSYFQSPEGIYVNLFVPSRVSWLRNGSHISIEQSTQYPYASDVSMRVHADRPETFTVFLRVPQWAGHNTSVSINGRNIQTDLQPGSFLPVKREWKDGDTIEYTIDRSLRLEAVDARHPNTVALLCGPVSLFAINSPNSKFTRAQLLAISQGKSDAKNWKAESAVAPVTFQAFPEIRDQQYRLYHEVNVG